MRSTPLPRSHANAPSPACHDQYSGRLAEPFAMCRRVQRHGITATLATCSASTQPGPIQPIPNAASPGPVKPGDEMQRYWSGGLSQLCRDWRGKKGAGARLVRPELRPARRDQNKIRSRQSLPDEQQHQTRLTPTGEPMERSPAHAKPKMQRSSQGPTIKTAKKGVSSAGFGATGGVWPRDRANDGAGRSAKTTDAPR